MTPRPAAPRPLTVQSVDYHTGGEPFRIISGGVGPIPGTTVLQRRAWAAEHLDHVRQLVINEPRGHADMYGCHVVPPDDEDGDLGVVFFHNEGYSTACGHGTIALATWAVESGVVPATPPLVELVIDAPSGRLPTRVLLADDGTVRGVEFTNVASFVKAHVTMTVEERQVPLTIAFGGAFYAVAQAGDLGLRVHPDDVTEAIRVCRAIKDALNAEHDFVHPVEPALRDIYGVILVEDVPDAPEDGALHQRNLTIFADGEVDRSPTGSGTSARLSVLHAEGRLAEGQVLVNRSVVDSAMTGQVVGTATVGEYPAVTTIVGGQAFRTGTHTFTLDPRDPLGLGFQLR